MVTQLGQDRHFIKVLVHVLPVMIKDQVAGDDKQKPLEVIILPDEFPRLPDLDKHLLYHILGYIPIIQIKPTEMINLFPILFIQHRKSLPISFFQRLYNLSLFHLASHIVSRR